MHSDRTAIPLTSAEISQLWTNYQVDSLSIIGLKHFLLHVEDHEIREILDFALDISKDHIHKLHNIFQRENYPIPRGFTDQDLNENAPRLFSDTLYLHYMLLMSDYSLSTYGLALATSARVDIVDYFTACLKQAKQLHLRIKQAMLSKGLLERFPILPIPEKIDFVKKQNYLAGWFGNRRPLTGVEISNIFYNMKRHSLGKALTLGFIQVTTSKEVKKYLERGLQLSTKHYDVFQSILKEDYLPSPSALDDEITSSTDSPFSDKLIMFHQGLLVGAGVSQYGVSVAISPRHDVGAHYSRLMAELLHYSEDGLNIMINNGWLEQLPMAGDRKNENL